MNCDDAAAARAACEFISPNGQEYHAAWGLPAPEVKLPFNVTALLNEADDAPKDGTSPTTVLDGVAH